LLIREVKRMTSLPVAVITNGSLFYQPEVRREVVAADAVLPSLDAGTADLYRRINRPHPEVTYSQLVKGLVAFREEYWGRLWVEVMLVRGLNDTPQELGHLAALLQKIEPDAVHINLPTRPPVETWVQPPTEESLIQAVAILGNTAEVVHPAEGSFDLSGYDNPVDAIVEIITRHPMREEELVRTLDCWSPGQVNRALAELKASGRAQNIERYGVRFWSAAASYYPDDEQSQRTAPRRQRRLEEDSIAK